MKSEASEMPETFSKFAIFTGFGEGLPLAYHLKQEGNQVLVGMVDDMKDAMQKTEDPETHKLRWLQYDGMLDKEPADKLLERMDKFEDKDEWAVIFDFSTLFKFATQAKKYGFKYGLFPTRMDYVMESDRNFAKEFVKKNYPDLKVADVEEFKTAEEATEFLKDSDEFWALKGNDESATTVVPSTPVLEHAKVDIQDALMANKEAYEKKGFLLERQIRDGIEVCPQAIFLDGKLIATSVDIEDKRFSETNGTEMEGCATNLIAETPLDCELNKWAFPPAAHELAAKHSGLFYIDANTIIKDGEAYYLEYCVRMGYDAIFAECDMAGGVGAYFNALLHGENPYEKTYGVGTRGFAMRRDDEGKLKDGLRIQYESDEHLWHTGIRQDGNKVLNTGAAYGDPYHGNDLVAFTESSDDAEFAIHKLHKQLEQYSLNGLYARSDLSPLQSRLDALERFISPPEEEE